MEDDVRIGDALDPTEIDSTLLDEFDPHGKDALRQQNKQQLGYMYNNSLPQELTVYLFTTTKITMVMYLLGILSAQGN